MTSQNARWSTLMQNITSSLEFLLAHAIYAHSFSKALPQAGCKVNLSLFLFFALVFLGNVLESNVSKKALISGLGSFMLRIFVSATTSRFSFKPFISSANFMKCSHCSESKCSKI